MPLTIKKNELLTEITCINFTNNVEQQKPDTKEIVILLSPRME